MSTILENSILDDIKKLSGISVEDSELETEDYKPFDTDLLLFINASFNRNIDMLFPVFTDYQKEHYKLALLEQCLYIFILYTS